ncbi:ABC transporter ATP-binding protein [Roseococcus sp. YIM B11640]|uniref:ABC transporter ATP-binding protein n=1 Tax=Roseococcus sp. YIM B11640 TaxID=3133973 RepID=UPI003C797705
MSLRLTDIRHAFGPREILRGVSLTVARGEILCLLGPSGDGKTTLLRLIAGLEALQHGRIELDGIALAEPGLEVPPEERHLGFVFQDYALFPHLTVGRNVGFGLRGLGRMEREARIAEALGHVGLRDRADAWPHQLSGGQQQRVALARALAPRPKALLLDEAFASLDARLRDQVRDDTLRVLRQAAIPAVIVTHDAEEALLMADRIALLRDGRVEQLGTPEELYLRPVSSFVASFLGEVNRLPAEIRGGRAVSVLGELPAPGLAEGAAAEFLLRPEGLRLDAAGQGAAARMRSIRLLGATTLVHLVLEEGGHELQARLPAGTALPPGEVLGVGFDPERAFAFPAGQGASRPPSA